MTPKIEKISLRKFDLSLSGMRIINPGWVVRIQNSMWLHGQLQPVVVRPHEGKYQVIDGIKRVYAASELMMKTLECYVLDVDLKKANLLFKVIDQRYNDNKSLIFTTNVEEPDWAEFLGDPITTSAILDRIFHHSVIVRINGPSYRMYQSELLQKQYAGKTRGKPKQVNIIRVKIFTKEKVLTIVGAFFI